MSVVPNVVDQGDPLTLTAYGVWDDNSVQEVVFYRDSNFNGVWDTGDVSLGSTTTIVAQQATISVSTGGLPLGTQRFFARARDDQNVRTYSAVTATARIMAPSEQPPSIGSLTSTSSTVTFGDAFRLTAGGVADPDGTPVLVEFYWDSNGNQQWDAGDERVHTDSSIIGGEATARLWATYPVGSHRFFASAKDNDGLWSQIRSTTVSVVGAAGSGDPTMHWVSRSPSTVEPGDQLDIHWSATDDVSPVVDHIGLYLYQGPGFTDAFKVDTSAYVAGGNSDGRLAANAYDLPDTGSYTWTVFANLPPADDYRVKVVAWGTDANTDYRFTSFFTVATDLPRIVSLSSDRSSVIEGQNQTVTFTATVADADGADYVQFVRDVDGNSQVDAGDSILGTGNVSGGLASIAYNTSGLQQGVHTFLARLRLDDGSWGNRRIRKVTVTGQSNQPPTVGSLSASPDSIPRFWNTTLTLGGISDDTGIDYAQFLWDFDGSGDASTGDSVLGTDSTVAGSEASLTFDVTRLDYGPQTIIARARDLDGAWSGWASTTVTIIPSATVEPFIGTLEPSSTFQPHAITLTITATDVTRSTNVLFYHDSNNNGSLDGDDELLINDDDGSNGWWWRNSPQNMGFPVGPNRFFAVGENEYQLPGTLSRPSSPHILSTKRHRRAWRTRRTLPAKGLPSTNSRSFTPTTLR